MTELQRRLEALLTIATELAAGNFAVPIAPEPQDDELAAIRAALDMLAGDLRTGARERLAARERAGLLKQVRQSESSLRALISQLPVHVWTVDGDRRISLPDADRPGPLSGFEREGQYIDAALALDSSAPAVAVHDSALAGREGRCELARDGRIWDLRVTPVRSDGEGVGAVAVAVDVTDERAAQAQQLHAQKLESLGVMAGGIAHDFNNLLVGVLANAGLALEDLPPGSASWAAIHRIERAAERAAELTRQLLAYSGKGRFLIEQVSLARLVQEMSDLLRLSLTHRAQLFTELDPDCPPVRGDATQLRQVVMNLITNAADASTEGGGGITVRVSCVNVDAQRLRSIRSADGVRPGRFCLVEVEDSGIGMDAATVGRIFDPFFTTKETGHGLGLAAVVGIVQGHGGAMEVKSRPGVGTTFRVYLPADQRPDETGEVAPVAPAPRTLRGHPWILVADDEKPVRDAARAVLERAGYRVVLAEDGRAAVETFLEDPERFHAAVLDLTMPVMSGAEAFAELRRLRPSLPILLTSGYNEREVGELIGHDRAVEFLQKPWRGASLLSVLGGILGRTNGDD